MFACSCESITNVTRCSSMNELVDDPEYLGAGPLGEARAGSASVDAFVSGKKNMF